MTPRISVITPSYNQAEFLPRTLQSVAAQTLKPIEHLVFDPGSTDGSREIAGAFKGVSLVAEPDKGQADAVARGMIEARGDVIAWLNSDDEYFDEEVFAAVADAFAKPDAPDILVGDGDYVDRDGAFIRPAYVIADISELSWRLAKEVGILQPATFIAKSLIDRIGPVDRDLRFCMDYEFWIRAGQSGARFGRIKRKLAKARYYSDNKTFGQRGDSLREVVHMTRKRFGFTHRDWLQRLADFEINGNDGILKESTAGDASNKLVLERTIRLNARVNGDYDAAVRLKSLSNDKIAQSTARDFAAGAARSALDYAMPIPLEVATAPNAQCYTVGPKRWAFDRSWLSAELLRSDALFEKLKSERRGDVCAIIGNGPSLKKANLSALEGVDTFVSNYAMLDKTLARIARYVCVTNYLVAEQEPAQFNLLERQSKFFPYWLAYCLTPTDNTCYLRSIGRPEFSVNYRENVSWRSTVTFFAMQIAYALGYRKVLMTGFDHSYIQPKSVEGDLIKQAEDDPNHFDPRYFKGKSWQAADTDNMEAMYRLAKDAFEADGREIVNCTVGGKLELFRRGDLATEAATAPRRAPRRSPPRLLIIDHTPIGDGTATGEIKSNIFATWPHDRLMQIAWSGDDAVSVRSNGDQRRIVGDLARISPPLWAEIAGFAPEVVLYRPVPDTRLLHDVAMSVIDHLGAPLALWIMDDWPAALAARDPAEFARLDSDWRGLLARSKARFSISEPMSAAFGERYGASFLPIANGVDPALWPECEKSGSGAFRIRFSGSLAENMSLDALRLLAEAVEKCARAGDDVLLEINTRQMWIDRVGARFDAFKHTKLGAQRMSDAEYREWLSSADALALAYNFDPASIAYVRYSLANKLPECLASGAPVIAIGPSDITTLATLDDLDCSVRVRTPDADEIASGLRRLISDRDYGAGLAERARSIAFDRFNIAERRTALADALSAIAEHERDFALPPIAGAGLDERAVAAALLERRNPRVKTILEIGESSPKSWGRLSGWTRQTAAALSQVTNANAENSVLLLSARAPDFGLSALKGFPWPARRPDIIAASTTAANLDDPAAAAMNEVADVLKRQGYSLYFSERSPKPAGGELGAWSRLAGYEPQKANSRYDYTLLGFSDDPGAAALRRWFLARLKAETADTIDHARQSAHKPGASARGATHAGNPDQKNERLMSEAERARSSHGGAGAIASAATALHGFSPRLYAVLRFFKRALGHFWTRRVWTLPLLAGALAWAFYGYAVETPQTRLVIWGSLAAAMLIGAAAYAAFRIQAFAERMAAENAALRERIAAGEFGARRQDETLRKLESEQRAFGSTASRQIDALQSELGGLQNELGGLKSANTDQAKSLQALTASVTEIGNRDGAAIGKLSNDVAAVRKDLAAFNQRYGGVEEVSARLEARIAANESLAKSTADLAKGAPANNAALYQRFNRRLTPAHLEEFNRDWRKRLSVNTSNQLLGYMAARACHVEAGLEGRLATSIEDVLLRTLVCLGVKGREISILEIGTLFGAGAAILYDALAPHYAKTHLTLLDPLDGYYDAAQNDILTGQPVNETVLRRNLRRAGVPDEALTLIKRLSTDVEAIKEAGQRQYDVLVIDGDHSYAGVKTDFDNYSPFVRLGGFIVIDDYGSPDWPDVTRFVDEEVSKRSNVTHVGTSWRTCVYRVVTPPSA